MAARGKNVIDGEKRKLVEYTGKILHLDGDKRYGEKAAKYYKSRGLNATVKYITENRQPEVVMELLSKYDPDILIITGHDTMLKKNRNYYNLSNYRNSKYFIDTVQRAREWERYTGKELTIFAGACESFFEAIMEAGADFASSPGRILIDFMDPLVVAEKIATTEDCYFVSIHDIARELKDGIKGVGGSGSKGKKIILTS